MAKCHGCDAELPQQTRGRPRKWCSSRCRKTTLYSSACIDCGEVCNRDGRTTNAAERCSSCARAHGRAITREWILASMREWHSLFGVPPTSCDWNQPLMRLRMAHEPVYAQKVIDRHESTGRPWPPVSTVQDHFGSWTAGLSAAGFTPISAKDRPLGYRGVALRDEEQAA